MGMDTVELVMAVESHFEIEIPNMVAEKLVAVGMLHAFVVAELERQGRPLDSSVVFEQLRDLICEQFAIDPKEVLPEARFIDDLRLD
jgi:acyl carrier protein